MSQMALWGGTSTATREMVEDCIRRGFASADLVEWHDSASASIDAAVAAFVDAGWTWDGQELRRDGWYAWFRSQGMLAPPIVQWGMTETERAQ